MTHASAVGGRPPASLIEELCPLGGSARAVQADGAGVRAACWAGERFLCALPDGDRSTLWLWAALDEPPVCCGRIDGTVGALVAAPDGQQVVAVARLRDGVGAIDLLDVESGDLRRWVEGRERWQLAVEEAGPVWSPDGRALALGARRREEQGGWTTLVRRVPSAERDAELCPDGGALPYQWRPEGLWLRQAVETPTPRYRYFGWAPRSGEVVTVEPAGILSPDGRYWLELEGARLTVTDHLGTRTIPAASTELARELDRLGNLPPACPGSREPEWLGGHVLVVGDGAGLALDLGRLAVQPFLPEEAGILARWPSPGGRHAVVALGGAAPRLLWGERQAPGVD
ncbi:MAG: hypothetical protein IT371_04790 [Deltaproteobacteria bacterium]|nr:hypothetical protein [Deltaproteobacteria bacterium]